MNTLAITYGDRLIPTNRPMPFTQTAAQTLLGRRGGQDPSWPRLRGGLVAGNMPPFLH